MLNFLNRDKPVKVRFYFDKQNKRMTWDDLNTLEAMRDGDVSARGLMSMAARFMADDNNNYLDHAKAMKVLGGLNEDDIKSVLEQFTQAIQGAAIPNTSGNPLNSPSVVGAATDSPAGSQP